MSSRYGDVTPEAAVLIALAGTGDDERVLLTQRAAHLTLHSGEVAFPGGKRELGDRDLQHTALRETHEEVGLDPALVQVVGQLKPGFTSKGMRVTPFVARVPGEVDLTPNLDELESLFWVPTAFLLEDNRQRTDVFETAMGALWAPVYDYLGYTIWGFTARVLVDYLNTFWSADIRRTHTAPSAVYRQPQTKKRL
jgi:8-oxo-dGTP pyrophosphatase MutT (NUDIX family)